MDLIAANCMIDRTVSVDHNESVSLEMHTNYVVIIRHTCVKWLASQVAIAVCYFGCYLIN